MRARLRSVGVASLADDVVDWVSVTLGTQVTVLRGLRHGDSPWLMRARDREVVLRVVRAGRAAETATEVAAMTYAARVAGATLPVADLLGYDLAERTQYGLVLTARVPGTSVIPPEPDQERLRALGAAAARISSIQLTAALALPVRSRPIEAEDFAAMRRDQGAPPTCCAPPRQRWPPRSRMTTRLAWCTATCGMAIRCGRTAG